MNESRVINSIRNSLYGMLYNVVSLLFPFVIRTLIIYQLGAEYLGLNGLFSAILQVLNLAELGFGNAIVYSMYKPIAESDEKAVCKLLNLYRKIYRIIGICILSVGIIMLPLLTNLIKGEVPKDINIYILYTIYIINTVSTYLMFSYKSSLYLAHQRSDKISKINLWCNIIMYLMQIIAISWFKNYYYYIIWLPITTIICNIVIGYRTQKEYPTLRPAGKVEREVSEKIKKNVFALMGHKVGFVALNSADTIFVSAFIGLTAVSIYNNYYYVIAAVEGIIGIFFTAILASVGNSLIVNSIERNYRTFRMLNFLNNWLTSWTSICIFCLLQHFMRLWVGQDYCYETEMVLLWTFFYYVHNIRNIINTYKDASGLWINDFWKPYIGVGCNVVLNLFLINIWGVKGIIIATIIVFLFIYIPCEIHVVFKNVFPHKKMQYIIEAIFNLIITILIGGVTYCFCNMVLYSGWTGLLLKAVICIFLPNLGWIVISFRRCEYQDIIKVLKGIFVK